MVARSLTATSTTYTIYIPSTQVIIITIVNNGSLAIGRFIFYIHACIVDLLSKYS